MRGGEGCFRNNSVPRSSLCETSEATPRRGATITRNSPTRLSPRSRPNSAVPQTMGPERLRRIDDAGQRCDGPSLSGRQSLRPRHAVACSRFQRPALVQLPSSGGARGWQVRKGEKATPVYFYKLIEIEDKTSDSGQETRRIPILRTFSVFHASQVDGIPALAPPAPPPLCDPPCAAPLGRAP
jgi:hypothetical protein